MARVYNFSAGPSMLPEEVLKTCANEMLEHGTIMAHIIRGQSARKHRKQR